MKNTALLDAQLSSMITAYRQSASLYALVTLGIIDQLAQHESVECDTLMRQCKLDPTRARRLLDFAHSMHILRMHGDTVSLLPLGRRLSDPQQPFQHWVSCELSPAYWSTWQQLPRAIRDASCTAFEHEHTHDFFKYLEHHPSLSTIFHHTMTLFTRKAASAIAKHHIFTQAQHVVDVGGGQGELLETICNQHAHLTGCVFDRTPHSTPNDRIRFARGNFLTDTIPSGDVILLKNILHDWDDTTATHILQRCSQALRPHGTLLIIETIKNTNPDTARGLGLDLLMMLLFSSQERTTQEYSKLAHAAGLSLQDITPSNGPLSILTYGIHGEHS